MFSSERSLGHRLWELRSADAPGATVQWGKQSNKVVPLGIFRMESPSGSGLRQDEEHCTDDSQNIRSKTIATVKKTVEFRDAWVAETWKKSNEY